MANVKVAVRVRPLSSREEASGGRLVIDLHEDSISITNIKMNDDDEVDHRERVRQFSFDYTYWSVDPSHPRHALQHMIYSELGTEVIDAAVEGYNACVLAYGQSGSGKTYTIMGTQEEPGLAPRVCEGLLARLRQLHHQGGLLEYSLTLSLVEIYKERVRDLLATGSAATRSLRVREHPRTGPYVEGVTRHAVREAGEAWALLERGRSSRSVAPTATHGESSRSHALLTLALTQPRTATHSTLTLVDLAGSERASQERDRARLAEGSNINKSLVTLGTVISALAERGNSEVFSPSGSSLSLVSGLSGGSPPSGGASGILPGPPSSSHSAPPRRQQFGHHHHNSNNSHHQQGHQGRLPFIPYRDSVLTWLLRDTLGGNAKTIMIATVSPSSTCFTESLGTLRYAARTRNIVNRPVVNEDPSAATIRSLRQEVSRLTKLLQYTTKSGTLRVDGGTSLLDLICDAQCRAAQLTHDWVNRWHGGGAGAGGSHLTPDRWRGSGQLPPEGDGEEEEDRVSGALCGTRRQLSASTGQLCSAPVWVRHSCSSLSSLEAIHSGAGLTVKRGADGSGEGRSCGSEVSTQGPSPRREWKESQGCNGLCVPGGREMSPRREYKGGSVGVPSTGGTSATTAVGGCRRQLVVDTQYPYLLNTPHDLHADTIVIHHLQTAETIVGSGGRDEGVAVTLRGPHVSPRHCSLFTSRGATFLSAYADGEVVVNGSQVPVGSSVRLQEGDLLALGSRRFTFHEATRPLPKPPPLAKAAKKESEFLISSVSSSASSSDPMTTSFVSSEVSSSYPDGGVPGGDEVPVRLLATSSAAQPGLRSPTPTSSASSTYHVSNSITTTATAQDALHPNVTAATTTNAPISIATSAASSAHLTAASSSSSSVPQGHKRGVAASGEYRQCPKRRRGGGDVKAGSASRTAETHRTTCGNDRSSSNAHSANYSGNGGGVRTQLGPPFTSHKRAPQQAIKCSCCPHSHVCPSCLNNNNKSQHTVDPRECPPHGSRVHLRREGHVTETPRPTMEGTKKIMKKLSTDSVRTSQLRNLWNSVKKSSSDSEYEDVEDLEVEGLMSPLAERTSPIGASHSEGNNSQSRGPDMTDQEDEDEEEEEEPQPESCLFHRRQDYGSDTSLDSLGSQHSKASLDSRMYRVSGNSNTYRSSRTFFLDLTGDGERRPCVSELCSPSESSPMAMPQSPTETRKRWDKSVWPEIEKGLRRNFSVPDIGQDDKGSRRRRRSPSPKQNSLDDKEKRQEIIDAVTRRLYPGSGPGFAKKEKKVPGKPKPQPEKLCRCRKKSQSESDSGSNTTPRVPKKSSADKGNGSTATTTTATTTITTTTSKASAAILISTSSTSSSSSKIPSDIVSRVPFMRRSSLEAPPGSHIPVPIPGPLRPERDRSPSAADPDPVSASHSAKQSRSASKRETKVQSAAPETSAGIKTIKSETRASTKSKTSQYTETKVMSQDPTDDAVVSKDSSDMTQAEPRGRRVLVPIQPNPDLLSDVAEADMMYNQYDSENGSEKRKIPLTKNLEALQKRLTSLSENSEQFSDDSLELQTPDEDAEDPTEPINLLRRPSDDVFTTSNISTLSKDSLEESVGIDSDMKENVLIPVTSSLAPELCNLGRGMPRSPGFSDLHALTAAAQSPQNPNEEATPKLKVNPYEPCQLERAPKTETYDSFMPVRAPKLSERHDSFIQSFFRSISHPDRSDTNFEIEEEELSSDEVSSALVTPKFATPAHATPTANRSLEESPDHVVQDVTNANVSDPLPDNAKYEPYHRPQPAKQPSPPIPQQQQQLQPPDAANVSPMTARRLIRERAARRILDTSSSEDSDPESRRRTRRRRKHRKTTPPLVSIPTIDVIEMQDQSEESDDYLSVLQSSPERRESARQEDDARNNNTSLNASTVLDNARSLVEFEPASSLSMVSNKINNKSSRKEPLTREAKRETLQRMGHVEAYSLMTNIQYSSVEAPQVPVVDTTQLLHKTATRLRPYSPTIPLTPQNTLEASLSIDEPQFSVGGDMRSHRRDETTHSLLQPPSKPIETDKKENATITKLLFASSEKLHRFTEDHEGHKPPETHSPTRSVSRATDLEEDYETAVGEETPWHESSSESRASFRTIEETSTSNVESEGTTTPVNTESSPDKKQRQKLSNPTNGVPNFCVAQHGTDKVSRQHGKEMAERQQNEEFFVSTSLKSPNSSIGVTRDINDNNGGLREEMQWDTKKPLESLTIESTDSGGSPAPASPNSEGFSTETSWEEMVLEEVNANLQEEGKCEDSKSMSQYTPSTARRLLYTIVECSESSRSEGAGSEPDLIPDDWRDSASEIEGGDDGASADGHLSYNGSEDRLSSSDDTLLDTVRHGEDPQPDSLSGIPDDIYEGKTLAGAYRGLARSYALTIEEGNVTGDSLEHLPTASPSPENGAKRMSFPQTDKEDLLLMTLPAQTETTEISRLKSEGAGLDAKDIPLDSSQKSHTYPFTPHNSFMEDFGSEDQNPSVDPNKLGISLKTEFPPPTPRNSICYENYDDVMSNKDIDLKDTLADLMELRGKEDSGQESGNISLAEEAYEISDVEETRQEDCKTFLESLEKSFVQTHSFLSENDGDLADLVSRSSGDRAPIIQVVNLDSAAPLVITGTHSSTPPTLSEEHGAKPFASATNSSGPSSAKPVAATSSSCPVPRATSDQDDVNEEKNDRNKEMKTDKQKPDKLNVEGTDKEESGTCEKRGVGDGAVVGLDDRGKIVRREGTEKSSLTQSGRETPLPRHDESHPPANDKRTENSETPASEVTTSLSSSTSSSSSSSSFSLAKKSFSFGMSLARLSGKKTKTSDVEISLQDNPPTALLPKENENEEEESIRRKLEADMSRYLHAKLKQLEKDIDVRHDRQENTDDAKVGGYSKNSNSADMKESSLENIAKDLREGLDDTCTNTDGQDISGLKNTIFSQGVSLHSKEFSDDKSTSKEEESLRDSTSPVSDGVTLEKRTQKDSSDCLVQQHKREENISSSSQDKKALSSQRLQSLQDMVESIRNSQDYDNWNMRRPHSLDLQCTAMPDQEVRQLQPFKDSSGKDIPVKDLHELIRQNSQPCKKGSLDIDHLLPDLRSSVMSPSPMEEHKVASSRKPPPRPPPATKLQNNSKITPEVKVFPCSPATGVRAIETIDQSSTGTMNKPKEPKLFLPLKTNGLDAGSGNCRNGGSRSKEASRTRHVEKLTSDTWHGHFIMEHDRSDHWTTSDESITFIFMSPSEEREAEPPKESREQLKQVENAYRSSSDLSNIGLSAGIPDEHRKPQYDLYKASHTTRGRLERSASVDSIYIALHKFERIKIKQEMQRTSSLENIITDELEDIIEKGRLFDSNDSKDEDDEDDDTPVVLSPVQEKKSLTKDGSLDLTEYKELAIKRAEYEYMKEVVSSSDDDVFSSHPVPTMTFGQKAWWDFESLVLGRPPKIAPKTSSEESSKSSPQLHKKRRDFSLNKKSVSWTDLDGCGALEVEVPDWTEMQDLVVPITKPKSIMKKPSLEPITSGSTPTPPTPPQDVFMAPQRPPLPSERPLPPPVPPRPVINKTVADAKNESSSDSDDIPLPRSNLKETFRLQLPEHIRERVRKSSATSSGSSSSSSSGSSKSSGTSSTSSNSSTEEDASPAKGGRTPSSVGKTLPPLLEPHSAPSTPSTSINRNPIVNLKSSSRRKSDGDLCGGVVPADVHGASQTWMALSKVMIEAGTILRTLSETSLVLHEQLVSPVVQGRRVSLPSLAEERSDTKNTVDMSPLLKTFMPKELVSVGIQTETVENNVRRETRSVLAQTSLDMPLHSGSSPYQRLSYIANAIDKSETSPIGKTLTMNNRTEVDRSLAQQQDSENANDTARSELTDNRREDINANVAQSHLVPNLASPLTGGGGIVDELNLLRNERERLNRLINKYERSSLLLSRQSYNLNLRNNNITPMENTTTTPPAPPSSVSPPRNVTETVQSAYEAGNERPPYYKYLSSTSQKYLSLYQKRLEDSCQRLEERLEINAKKRQLRSQLLSNKHSHLSLTSLSGTESPSKLSSTEVKNFSIHGSLDLAQQSFGGGGGLRLGTGTTSSSSVSLPTMSHCSPSRNLKEPSSSPCCCVSPSHRHHQHFLCSPARTSPFGHSSALCHNLPSHLSDSHMASSSSTTTTQLSTQQCRQQLLQLRRKLINASSSMNSSSSSVANSPSSSRPYGSSISTSGTGGVEVGMDIASVTSLRGPYRRSHAASLGELPGGGAALGQVSWSRGLRGSSASVVSDTEAYHRLRPQLSLDSDSDSGAFSASGLNLRHTRSNHTFL